MKRNFYSEINLHITWHTKESSPLLVPKVEAEVHHYLKGRCINTPGVFVYEVGGTETHVHLCVSVWPTLLISDFIGALKGSSSHEANQKFGSKVLQ
jgi:putative transposase